MGIPLGQRLLYRAEPPLTGEDIRLVQHLYNLWVRWTRPSLGPIGPELKEDGIYGPEMAEAIRYLQEYGGLSPDGIVGPDTYLLLGHGVARHTPYGGPAFGSRQLTLHMEGSDVRVLKQRLATTPAARFFQKAESEGASLLDRATWVAYHWFIRSVKGGIRRPRAVTLKGFHLLWRHTFAGGRDLTYGAIGLDVAWVQRFLKEKGFYSYAIDGRFEEGTWQAVRKWQKAQGLKPTGEIRGETYRTFGLEGRALST
ncbi:MAG: peptidoglycan-binding protein [Clostridiales bacterium]|nr:peptidoglycan-binding protein [Clostridiales bacterium]